MKDKKIIRRHLWDSGGVLMMWDVSGGLLLGCLNLGGYEFVALAVDVDDFNLWVILEVLAQLGDVYIHTTCIEVVVIDPDGLQGKVALEYLIGVGT